MIWYGMFWYDMIWYVLIWYDMIWYDMIWYDMIRYDMICYVMLWYDMLCNVMIWYDMVCSDMIWYDMIRYDMIWCDMIWYDMIWYDMIWYDMIWYHIITKSYHIIFLYNRNAHYNIVCLDKEEHNKYHNLWLIRILGAINRCLTWKSFAQPLRLCLATVCIKQRPIGWIFGSELTFKSLKFWLH